MHDARSLPLLDRLADRLGRGGIAVDRALAEGLVRQQTGLAIRAAEPEEGRRHRGVDAQDRAAAAGPVRVQRRG